MKLSSVIGSFLAVFLMSKTPTGAQDISCYECYSCGTPSILTTSTCQGVTCVNGNVTEPVTGATVSFRGCSSVYYPDECDRHYVIEKEGVSLTFTGCTCNSPLCNGANETNDENDILCYECLNCPTVSSTTAKCKGKTCLKGNATHPATGTVVVVRGCSSTKVPDECGFGYVLNNEIKVTGCACNSPLCNGQNEMTTPGGSTAKTPGGSTAMKPGAVSLVVLTMAALIMAKWFN